MRQKRPILRSMSNPQSIATRQGHQHGDNCWWTETGWQCCTNSGMPWPSCVAGGVTFHQKHGSLPPNGSYAAAIAAGAIAPGYPNSTLASNPVPARPVAAPIVTKGFLPSTFVVAQPSSFPGTITQQYVRMSDGPWLLGGLAVPVTSNIVPPQVTGGTPRAWVRIYPDAAEPKLGSWWKATLYRNWGATAEAVLAEPPTIGSDGLLRARVIPMPATVRQRKRPLLRAMLGNPL